MQTTRQAKGKGDMEIGKAVTITVKFHAVVDDAHDTLEATGYVLDSGQLQDALIEYAADHGCKVEIVRTWHDVNVGFEVV